MAKGDRYGNLELANSEPTGDLVVLKQKSLL